jgi:C_GCAxxG_C_C family probable redox protein
MKYESFKIFLKGKNMTSMKPSGENMTMDRRAFFGTTIGWSTGLMLLACPGIAKMVMGQEGIQAKKGLARELEEKAKVFMPKYMSCALTSFAVLNDHFKLGADMKTIRALMPFTGGLASRGETCGAVSGSLLAIGLFFESNKPGSSIKAGGMFFDAFEKAFGSTRCREVVKHQYGRYYDFRKLEDMKAFMEAAKSGKCLEVVQKAVSTAGNLIAQSAQT